MGLDLLTMPVLLKSRVSRSALAAVLAAFMFVLFASGSAQAKHPQSLYWGAQIGEQMTGEQAPWDMRPVKRFQKLAGKGLSLIEFASPFAECNPKCVFAKFPTTPLENARSYGAIPIFSWNSGASPPEHDQSQFQLSDLIEGRYDNYIREFATEAAAWGHPFFLRFDWEMNGFWFPWGVGTNGNSPADFVPAWRHVHHIFDSVGATNATWVWCPNVEIHGNLNKLNRLYPGGRYVDWTCLDGFNWGDRAGSPGWLSFDQIFGRTYHHIATQIAPNKPMMIAEMASTDRGGNKPAWIKNMLSRVVSAYRKVRGLVWYDVNDRGTHWPLETSKTASNAFKQGIARSAFRPNEFGNPPAGPIAPPR
jgi:hypothetical protein